MLDVLYEWIWAVLSKDSELNGSSLCESHVTRDENGYNTLVLFLVEHIAQMTKIDSRILRI